MTIKPITPEDIKKSRMSAFNRDLIQIINDLLSERYESDHVAICISLREILNGMAKRGFTKSQVLKNLNFEHFYNTNWWVVFREDGLDGTSGSCWLFNTRNV